MTQPHMAASSTLDIFTPSGEVECLISIGLREQADERAPIILPVALLHAVNC